ncbi:MAG: glycosyltransferase [Streptococcus sp.]|nr:glycosyltransferase [Streptococcus sp.]
MKKILFISPTGTLDNGAEISMTNLMVYLAKQQNYQVYNIFPESVHPSQSNYKQLMDNSNISSLSLTTLEWWWEDAPEPSDYDSEAKELYYQENIYKIRQFIRKNKIDLVITNTANTFYGSVAASMEKVPHYWFIHEFPLEEFSYYKEKLPFIVANSEAIFAVKGSLTDMLNELISEFSSARVIPFVPYFKIENTTLEKNDDYRILSIGKINENKNQLELLKAYHQMNLSYPLHFIGGWDEEYKKICDDYIEQKSLKNVYFHGHQAHPWRFARDHDIAVFTSCMETFGLVYAEALLNTVPSVISNNPGYLTAKEVLGEGNVYKLHDVSSLMDSIKKTFDDFDLYKRKLVEHQEKFSKLMTIENCFSSFFEIVKKNLFYNEKSLTSMNFLLGHQKQNDLQLALQKEKVLIFYKADEENYLMEHSLEFPLKKKDCLTFSIPDNTTEIRIDLSELPLCFQNIKLVSEHFGTEMLPKYTNGFLENGFAVFNKNDPQIIFDTYWYGNTFTLTYELSAMNDEHDLNLINYLLQKYSNYQNENDILLGRLKKYYEKLNTMEHDYSQLATRYNAVVGSRRWLLTTKILNFLRRKK